MYSSMPNGRLCVVVVELVGGGTANCACWLQLVTTKETTICVVKKPPLVILKLYVFHVCMGFCYMSSVVVLCVVRMMID